MRAGAAGRFALLCVGLLLAGLAPLPAHAQDALAPWDDGAPVVGGLPDAQSGRHFRVQLDVEPKPGLDGLRDLSAFVALDLTELLRQAGYPTTLAGTQARLSGFTLDLGSFLLREVAGDGTAVGAFLPVQVLPDGAAFNATTNPLVDVTWIVPGASAGARHFHLYFDSLENGHRTPRSFSAAELAPLAAAIGPGRATRLYVPLPPLSGSQGEAEARRVRVTNLATVPATVQVFEYTQAGLPRSSPTTTLTLGGLGDMKEYVLGNKGLEASTGGVLLVASSPVTAEALLVPSSEPRFMTGDFVPSADGGFVGASFVANVPPAAAPELWTLYCPRASAGTLPSGAAGCVVRNGPAIAAGGATQQSVGPGPVTLAADQGKIAVQRVGQGLADWPAMDGPGVASSFLGHANAKDALLVSVTKNVCLNVVSLGRGNPSLANDSQRLCVERGSRQERPNWGTTWARTWETGGVHEGGAVAIQGKDTRRVPLGGIRIVSGSVPDSDDFSSLVTPQSPDGGFTYDFFVPQTAQGQGLGQLVLFSPFGGTVGTASLEGGPTIAFGPLSKDQRRDIGAGLPGGLWHIHADHPVLLAWLKKGAFSFGGPVPGILEASTVTASHPQFAGFAIGLGTATPIQQAKAGDGVRFSLDVRNLARDVTGRPLADTGALTVLGAPPGWLATLSSSGVALDAEGAGAAKTVDLQVQVPASAAQEAGATFVVRAQTHGFHADQLLRINLVVSRIVSVTADGERSQLDDAIAAGDSPTYLIQVINRGTVRDAYDLRLSVPGGGWTRTFVPAIEGGNPAITPPLEPGGNATYYLTVTPPPGAAARGARLVTILQAVSTSDSTVQAAVRVTTSISVNRAFSVQVKDPVRNVAPGGNTTFLVQVKNDSDAPQELNVQVVSAKPGAWQNATVTWLEKRKVVPPNGNVTMDIQGNITLAVTRAVPAGAAPLTSAIDLLRLRDNLDHQAAGSDTRLHTIAARVAGFTATVPTPPTAIPGQKVALSLALRSTSNVNQVLNVTARLPQGGGPWSLLDANGRAPPWTVQLAAGRLTTLALSLQVPANAPPSGVALSNLTLVATGAGAAVRTIPVVLSVPSNLAVSVEAATLVLGAGHPADADAVLRNQGNLATRVTLTWVGLPPGWDVGATEVELPVNATLRVPLLVDVPSAAAPGRTAVTLEAHEAGSGVLLGSAPWSLV
ncbi:MAG TPA: hypothetical protein VM241_04110, partial [Candidatus Thermoplasmatota archaeon]|nr:hypothetical protein [Candidatus Thermoplasmatota archaeon]